VSGRSWANLINETYVEPCGLDVLGYTNHYLAMYVRGGGIEGAVSYPDFICMEWGGIPCGYRLLSFMARAYQEVNTSRTCMLS